MGYIYNLWQSFCLEIEKESTIQPSPEATKHIAGYQMSLSIGVKILQPFRLFSLASATMSA